MTDIDESKLIADLRASIPAAQKRFLDLYSDPLIQWIFALGARCTQDAEEIMDDAFLRAYKGIGTFKEKSGLKTWLFALARNAKIDYYRSPKNESVPSDVEVSKVSDFWTPCKGNYRKSNADVLSDSMPRKNVVEPASPQFDELLQRETGDRLRRTMNQLSDFHREILLLRWIEGFSVKEAAVILKKSPDAVKMGTMRALQAIRDPLAEDPYFGGRDRTKEATLS